MLQALKKIWLKTPAQIRKPIVMTIGMSFVIAAGLTGWLPGPGGIPLFLIGIAILATEFHWAMRVRDGILGLIERIGRWLRQHPVIGPGLIAAAIVAGICSLYVFATHYL